MKDIETSFTKSDDPTNRGLPNTLATTRSTESASLSPVSEKRMVLDSMLAGSVAGITSTIACHPFDVLRVKMQSSAPVAMSAAASAGSATTATATATRAIGLAGTVRNMMYYGGGIRAFYTGLAMPLAAQAVYKGTIFTVNNVTESYIRAWKTRESHNAGGFESPYKLTLADRFVSGFMGGAVNAALFCTPVEFVRNQQIAQIENTNTTATTTTTTTTKYNKTKSSAVLQKNGPLSVIRRTIHGNGFAGLWRGMASTVLRDSVGCGFFFLAMAYTREQLTPAHSDGLPPKTPVLVASGIMAGVSFWLWGLPVDTMKTWIQNGTASNLTDAVRLSQRHGLAQSIPSLFRGWQVAYFRGAPSAAITVWTYSLATQYLQRDH